MLPLMPASHVRIAIELATYLPISVEVISYLPEKYDSATDAGAPSNKRLKFSSEDRTRFIIFFTSS